MAEGAVTFLIEISLTAAGRVKERAAARLAEGFDETASGHGLGGGWGGGLGEEEGWWEARKGEKMLLATKAARSSDEIGWLRSRRESMRVAMAARELKTADSSPSAWLMANSLIAKWRG